MIASVSGRRIWAVVPCAGLGGQQDLAAELADLGAHGVHADAAAGDVVGLVAVEKPGAKSSSMARAMSIGVGLLGGDQPALDRLGGDARAGRRRGRRRRR